MGGRETEDRWRGGLRLFSSRLRPLRPLRPCTLRSTLPETPINAQRFEHVAEITKPGRAREGTDPEERPPTSIGKIKR